MSVIQPFEPSIGRKPTGSGGNQAYLFLDQMMQNPKYRTVIHLPSSVGGVSTIVGISEGPFGFQGKSDWKALADQGNGALATADQSLALLKAAGNASGLTEADKGQLNIKSVWLTESRWNGSDSPVFNFKLILPSYNSSAGTSPMDYVKLLMKCVYPTQKTVGLLTAPLGYDISDGDTPINTITVTRGNFFRAPNQVMKSVSCSVSQEMMDDGYPLYVEANIEFMPWRMPTYDDVMSYFIL
jgi:hypothetical protein